MRIHPAHHRLRRAAACAAVVLASTAAAASVQAAEPGVPTEIQVPAGNKLFLEAHATGVQIYDCVAVAGGYAWSAATPAPTSTARTGSGSGSTTAARHGRPRTAARSSPSATAA